MIRDGRNPWPDHCWSYSCSRWQIFMVDKLKVRDAIRLGEGQMERDCSTSCHDDATILTPSLAEDVPFKVNKPFSYRELARTEDAQTFLL